MLSWPPANVLVAVITGERWWSATVVARLGICDVLSFRWCRNGIGFVRLVCDR